MAQGCQGEAPEGSLMTFGPDALKTLRILQLGLRKALDRIEERRESEQFLGWINEARGLNRRFGELLTEVEPKADAAIASNPSREGCESEVCIWMSQGDAPLILPCQGGKGHEGDEHSHTFPPVRPPAAHDVVIRWKGADPKRPKQ